jgi:hypothetical protein
VRACGLDAESAAGRVAIARIAKQASLLVNAMVPLAIRRAGLTDEIRAQAKRARPSGTNRAPAMNLTDYARVQSAVEAGDFCGALFREGLDPIAYARIREHWTARLEQDADLRADYARVTARLRELAVKRTTDRLPLTDPIVLPGEKLARVSDFARISRAAKQGRFKEALDRAGVDHATFAALCARFNERMEQDKTIEAQFKRMLQDARLDPAA